MLLRFAVLTLGAASAATYLREESNDHDHDHHDHDHHPMPKEACMGEEKGLRCHASFKDGKGFKECEAGLRKNITAAFGPAVVASSLYSHMHEMLPGLDDDFFFPSSSFDSTMMMNDDLESLLQEGELHEMAFGGEAHIDFGCKVAFEKKEGKIHKKVECGMKMKATAGKKQGDLDDLQVANPPIVEVVVD